MEARKKVILSERDRMERMKFARAGKKEYDAGFFNIESAFTLMGSAFGTKEIGWTMPVLPKAKYCMEKTK